MSIPIPEDGRHDMAFLREFAGSDDKFRKLIWDARNAGHRQRAIGKWPIRRVSGLTNVTPIRDHKKRGGGK
jgi:hypothetical protein